MKIFMVGAGGFIGAVMRYLITMAFPIAATIPMATLTVNFVGSFIIGCFVGLTVNISVNSSLVLLIQVGICGGFTTFSAFSLETVSLIESGKMALAFIYILLSVSLCLLAVWSGKCLANHLLMHLF